MALSENSDHAIFGKHRDLLIGIFLALITLIAYWQVQYFDLIDYDDVSYIVKNRHVRSGLSWDGFIWAMTDIHTGYWHPLTWLSHMLDYQLFKLNASGHHWTSLIFHMANVVLLYILLARTTGRVWQSAFAAALFAVHPLNVESVAWIAERKNVLSTFFLLMAMWAYACYVDRPTWYRYALVLLAFVFGLMAKPMLVTLPFVLLLLDYWPLGRLNEWKDAKRLLIEKIPLFVMTIAVSVFTFLATRHEGAVISFDVLSFGDRILNVVVSYTKYLVNLFWPADLAVFYPFSTSFGPYQIAGAAAVLFSVSFFVILLSKRYRYLPVGWLWYLGTLVPVIGFIQAGDQAMADRYMYVPGIGLFVMITWGVSDFLKKWPKRNIVSAVFAGAVLFVLIMWSVHQAGYWRNSLTLFGHALEVTRNNALAHNNLGVALLNRGRPDEAQKHFCAVIRIKRDYPGIHTNMGLTYAYTGNFREAVASYREALRINKDDEKAHNNLGALLAGMGKYDEAALHFQDALRINPDNADTHNNMGAALARQGRVVESLGYFKKALQLDDGHYMAHNNMGLALANLGRFDEATRQFMEALNDKPDYRDAYNNLNAVSNRIKAVPSPSSTP
jgi:Tfp pilus assembly protein PilF